MVQQVDIRSSSFLNKRVPHISLDMLPTPVVKPTVQRRGSSLATHILHAAVQILLAETFLHTFEDQS
jgi:transcriptional regulator of met regulon